MLPLFEDFPEVLFFFFEELDDEPDAGIPPSPGSDAPLIPDELDEDPLPLNGDDLT